MSAMAPSLNNDEAWTPEEEVWADSGFWANLASLLGQNKIVIISGIMVLLFILAGTVGPDLYGVSYEKQDIYNTFAPPLSPGYVAGTDHLGRDMLARVLYGVRISLLVSVVVTVISLVLGMAVGIFAGYYGGRLDFILSSIMDIAWGFPMVLIAILFVAAIGPGIPAILVGMTIVNWAGFGRIIRGEVLALREKEFIEAAKALGVSDLRIFGRHLIPNTFAVTLVMASFYMGIVIIAEALLSFVGLGAQPPLPSLGQILAESRNYMLQDIWMTALPGVVLAFGILGFNLLGDGLRDMLDPRLRV
jgi:peptide/nickel transport system permease protein